MMNKCQNTQIKAQAWQARKTGHIRSDTHETIDQRWQGFGCLAQGSVVGSLHFEQPFLQAPVHKPHPTTTSASNPELRPRPILRTTQLTHIPFLRLPFCVRARSAWLPLRAWAFVAAPTPSKHGPSKRGRSVTCSWRGHQPNFDYGHAVRRIGIWQRPCDITTRKAT